MHFKPSVLAVGLATTAVQAFLVPPDITSTELLNTLAIPETAEHQSLGLLCPACPLLVRMPQGIAQMRSSLVDSLLEFNFSVEANPASPGSDRLLVNELELYPGGAPYDNVIAAAHKAPRDATNGIFRFGTGGDKAGKDGFALLDAEVRFSLAGRGPFKADVDSDAIVVEYLELDMQIDTVSSVVVNDIDNVRIRLIQLMNVAENKHDETYTKLLIGSIETIKPKPKPDTVSHHDMGKCTSLYCRLVEKAKAIASKGHCGGMRKTAPVDVKPTTSSPSVDAVHDKYELPHAHHTWKQLARRVWDTVLLPAFFGICVGVAIGIMASCIGVVVSGIFIHLWRTCIRGKRVGKAHHHRRKSSSRNEKAAIVDEEKVSLMAADATESTDDDLLPAQDDDYQPEPTLAQMADGPADHPSRAKGDGQAPQWVMDDVVFRSPRTGARFYISRAVAADGTVVRTMKIPADWGIGYDGPSEEGVQVVTGRDAYIGVVPEY